MKALFRLLPLTLLISTSLSASVPPGSYSDQGRSTAELRTEDGQQVFVTTHVSFGLAQVWATSEPLVLLLKKTQTEKTFLEAEGSTAKLQVEARESRARPFDQVAWTLNENAHGGSFDGTDLYLTWQNGCCGASTAYRAYQIETGRLLLSYDDRQGKPEGAHTTPFVIEIPNTALRRYLGVLTSDAGRDFQPGKVKGAEKFATITYSSSSGPLQIVDVYGPLPEGWGMSTESQLVDLTGTAEGQSNRLTLWESDSVTDPVQAFQGLALEMTFSAERTHQFRIPLKNDRLDLQGARLPAGFQLMAR